MFRDGQDLLKKGRVTEACAKFETSYVEDPQLGTLLNLAFCHEKAMRFGRAWLEFREAETRSAATGNKERERFARDRRTGLEKDLMECRVEGTRLEGVFVDGDRVAGAEKGEAFFVEPGLRTFRFVDAGGHVRVRDVLVNKGALVQTIRPPEPSEVAVAERGAKASRASTEPSGTKAQPSPWTWTAYGAGAVGLGVGIASGVHALNQARAGRDENDETKKSTARTFAIVSDVSFVLAGAGAVCGTLLLVYPFGGKPKASLPKSAEKSPRPQLMVDVLGSGARLTATF
jgi:hypothetical protein